MTGEPAQVDEVRELDCTLTNLLKVWSEVR